MSATRGGTTGARGILSGTISSGATWQEDIAITQDGGPIPDAETWEWQMSFRKCPGDSVCLRLSTDDGTLAIMQGDESTVLQIRVPNTSLSGMCGDYTADIASQDGDDVIVHWAHGLVTFRHEPVWG